MTKEKLPSQDKSTGEKKSNIYVMIELNKIIKKLETDKERLKPTLADQAVYFHLINPKHLSPSLAEDWITICNFVGFDGEASIFNATKLKTPIKEKVSQFTDEDIAKLMSMLYILQANLEAELQG